MITKNKRIIALILAVLFITFTVLLACTIFSDKNIRARDYLDFEKTDLGQLSYDSVKHRQAESRVKLANTLTVVYSVLSVCSLASGIAVLCVKKK